MIEEARCPACRAIGARRAFDAINRREGNGIRGTYLRCISCGTLRLADLPDVDTLRSAYATGEIDAVDITPASAVSRVPAPTPPLRWLGRQVRRALFGRPHAWPEQRTGAGRILDFGCLDGSKLLDFYQRGWEVCGVDLNRSGIERARARMPEGFFFAGPIEEMPPGETFDVIRTDNVLEHIPDPLPILEELRRRLRNTKQGRGQGQLLAYVPSGESLSVRLFGERSASVWVPYHLTLFSRRGLQLLFREAGFSRVQVTPFSPPDWWNLTARQLVALPGFISQPPTARERMAQRAQTLLLPALLALSRTKLAEEWVVQAFQ